MQISKHFSLHELVRSQTAARHGIDNEPTPAVLDNLRRLCVQVLEPARDACDGRPIIVTSGYRSPQLNARIGGAPGSMHMRGLAADIEVAGMSIREAAERLVAAGVEYERMIVEYPLDGWLHLEVEERGHMPARGLAVVRRGQLHRWLRHISEAWQ